MTAISSFMSEHTILAVLIVSVAWFGAGWQSSAKGKRGDGLGWQIVSLMVLVAGLIKFAFD